MLSMRTKHLLMAVAAVAVVIIVAGGPAYASNAGFKLNKHLVPGTCNPGDQIGVNWTSIPFFNPYSTWADFCTQTALPTGAITGAQLTVLNQVTGTFTSARCGTAGAGTLSKIKGKGVAICPESAWPASTGVIIVGSHDPTFQINVDTAAGSGQVGRFWYALPYHTTNSTCAQLCTTAGLTPGALTGAQITRLNALNGQFSNARCGAAACNTLPLPLGEHIQIAEPNAPKSFVPAHF